MSDEELEEFMEKVEPLSDKDKAILSGCILEEVDPTEENLRTFWDQLDTTCKEELTCRIDDLNEE